MTLFESLLMAHLLGDWLLQTEWQAQNKAHNWSALLIHLGVYHVLILAVLLWQFSGGSGSIYVAVAFLLLTHAVMDRKSPVTRLMKLLRITRERPPERWLTIAVDQAIHLLLLGLVTVFLTAPGSGT